MIFQSNGKTHVTFGAMKKIFSTANPTKQFQRKKIKLFPVSFLEESNSDRWYAKPG